MHNHLILMRHAQGTHNQKKKQMKQKDQNYKDKKPFKQIKFSKQFIDPKQIYIPQNYQLRSFIDLQTISLILVSPLRRCLQTARHIKKQFQQIKKDVQIIVQPFLASRLCSAWALGSFTQQLQDEYKQFAFKNVQNYWFLNFLINHKIKFENKSSQEIKQQLLSHLKDGIHESFKDLNIRIQKLKKKINEHKQKTTGNILIISHSCLLKALCAKQFQNSGKSKGELKFKHLIPIFASNQFCLSQIPGAKL